MKNVMIATLFAFGLSAFAQEPTTAPAGEPAAASKPAAPADAAKKEKKAAKKGHGAKKGEKKEGM